MTTITHTAPLSTGGTTSLALAPGSRYANHPDVVRDGDVFTAGDGDGTVYQVHPCETTGWGVYRDDGVDLIPVAGAGFANGIATADQAIGALIGDAEDQS